MSIVYVSYKKNTYFCRKLIHLESMTEQEKQEIYEQAIMGRLTEDIVVLEDVHIIPIMNEEFHSQYFYIGMCTSGYSSKRHNFQDYDFHAGEICWVLPDHMISHNFVSKDYSVLSVFISKSFFLQLKQNGMLGKYQYTINMSSLALSPEVFDIIYNGFLLIGKLSRYSNSKDRNMIPALFNIIYTVCDDYIAQSLPYISKRQKQHDLLFEQFYDAITLHYRESREVSFYAKLLCLSPKYFASIIKKSTNIEAKEWINRYVIIEAKWMLLHERQKSIQQIANYLGFSEQASFSRLFKHIEGITPTEFRNHY